MGFFSVKILPAAIILAGMLVSVPIVYAQNADVEVNNQALESYVPPPMFGTPSKPELSRRLSPDWSPTLTTGKTGDISAEEVLNAPVPQLKPGSNGRSFSATRISKKLAVDVEDGKSRLAVPLPPLPPRRPRVMNASPSYTERYIKRSPQADIPVMPAVPAEKVDTEVLYRAPDQNKDAVKSPHSSPPEPFFLEFERGRDVLTRGHMQTLFSRALPALQQNRERRIVIAAFALPADDTQSSARRVSLNRALSVRSFLIDKGVAPDRIDVRANGADTNKKPVDRVDLVFDGPET